MDPIFLKAIALKILDPFDEVPSMNIIKLVLKNISRRKFRFLLTLFGITIGIATIAGLLFLGIEMERQVIARANALGADAMITPQNWCSYEYISVLEGEQVGEAIPMSDVENISKINGIIVSPIIVKSTGIEGKPVTVTGILPSKMMLLRSWKMRHGQYLYDNDTFSAILGSSIAVKFSLGIGDTVGIREHKFNITGILEQTNTNDDISIFIPLETAENIYNTENKVSFILIRVDDISKMDNYILEIQNAANVNIITNQQIIQTAVDMIKTVQNASLLMLVVAIIAGFFGIVNTMATAVHERKREIGIQKAIGANKSFIFKQFFIESLIIGTLGGLLGYIIGFIASFTILPKMFPSQIQTFKSYAGQSIISFSFDLRIFLFCVLFSITIAVVAGLYPAWRASKLTPMEAMTFG